MEDIKVLHQKRDDLLAKLQEIDTIFGNPDPTVNQHRETELLREQGAIDGQIKKLQSTLDELKSKAAVLRSEFSELNLRKSSADIIVDAIGNQRWYFFADKPQVLMDRNTCILWNNPAHIPYVDKNGSRYSLAHIQKIIKALEADGFRQWMLPTVKEYGEMADESFPFYSGPCHIILDCRYAFVADADGSNARTVWSDRDFPDLASSKEALCIICNHHFLADRAAFYGNAKNFSDRKKADPPCTDFNAATVTFAPMKEYYQFILNLFISHGLHPVFNDPKITELYETLYFEKPALQKQLQETEAKLKELDKDPLAVINVELSYIDHKALLRSYDISAIDGSLIQYHKAVQQWCGELLVLLDQYEASIAPIAQDLNTVNQRLSKKLPDHPSLTEEENAFLRRRQDFFLKKLPSGLHRVKAQILSLKAQADALERRLEEIDEGDSALRDLALLEREPRASFMLIAENTAKIFNNALKKVHFFQSNRSLIMSSLDALERWNESYYLFKSSYRDNLKLSCEEDIIEDEIFESWYENWRRLRIAIEEKLEPLIEHALRSSMAPIEEKEISIPEQLIVLLEDYRNKIDKFFSESRKGIYVKYAFLPEAELQDKLEGESEIYKLTTAFQQGLQEIIFNCTHSEDRIFLLRWAKDLLEIQIDEVVAFLEDRDLDDVSRTLLTSFSLLKQQNFEAYLTDAHAYSTEKARRDKEYNALIFKMRKSVGGK